MFQEWVQEENQLQAYTGAPVCRSSVLLRQSYWQISYSGLWEIHLKPWEGNLFQSHTRKSGGGKLYERNKTEQNQMTETLYKPVNYS